MNINVLWNNIEVLCIEKLNGLYISHVFTENLVEAQRVGFPIYFLKQICAVSDELPVFIKNRIYNVKNIKEKIAENTDLSEKDIEKNIYEYINATGCRRPTDKFSIKITIKK